LEKCFLFNDGGLLGLATAEPEKNVQYTKVSTAPVVAGKRTHKSIAKNNNFKEESLSPSCAPSGESALAPSQQVLVTRNMIAGKQGSDLFAPGGGLSKADVPAPPEIVFPREPLLPSEIQGFVSGLGYRAGELPAFSTPNGPPPPSPACGKGSGSGRSSSAKAKSRVKTKENTKVLPVYFIQK
jgi:hypothetical protein